MVKEEVDEDDIAAVVASWTGIPVSRLLEGEVEKLIHIKTLYLGPDELLVAAKLGFSSDSPLVHVASDIDRIEARIRAAVPTARVIYLEPDIYRPGADRTPPTEEFVIKSAD